MLVSSWKLAPDPENKGRRQQWFKSGPPPEAREAPVPGIIQQVFPDYHGVAWYWHTFRPEMNTGRNSRCLLRFGAVDYLADVWLNGIPVGGHEGGETPFTLDVTDALRPAEDNLLAVRVLNPSDEPIDGIRLVETPHRSKEVRNYMPGFTYDFGGIILPVELLVVPAVHIIGIFARPDSASGKIRLSVTVRNDTKIAARNRISASAGPDKTGEILDFNSRQTEFSPGESVHELTAAVAYPRLWNLDDPYLYRVTVSLDASGNREADFSHQLSIRCGFRELRVENGYFRLNGKRIFLRSTHTANHYPIGQVVPANPDFLRRDLLYAKSLGFNTVRFISGLAFPEQLDFCDEIGLMVYEESMASWLLANSPQMPERFDRSVREMVRRDRNHPSLTIWGLLNEENDGPVFRHAVEALALIRSLDETRLVLLNSGRFDRQQSIGSLSNPDSREWEYQWGAEHSNASAAPEGWHPVSDGESPPGCIYGAGDIHIYPIVPQSAEVNNFIRTFGQNTNPVFLSEYGIGSLFNAIREGHSYEQAGARPDLPDATLIRSMSDKLRTDWQKWGFDGVYPFPEDMLRESQRLHDRQRLLGFDLIRSNPKICGFNVTGMLDHGITGEGLWTFWRELKPGIADVLTDGWAPLRWCLFANPLHGYTNRPVKLEAVLANEDMLPPGEYPVSLNVSGPTDIAWKQEITLRIPKPETNSDPPLSIPVFSGEVVFNGPAGEYTFAANLERGGAPAGGHLLFHLSDPDALPQMKGSVTLLGVDEKVEAWLVSRGIRCRRFSKTAPKKREIILVGTPGTTPLSVWQDLAQKMACGSTVVFLSPLAFNRGPRATVGKVERKKVFKHFSRDFEVANVPKEEWKCFGSEFYGQLHYVISDVPDQDYVVEVGMCEGFSTKEGARVFDVMLNGSPVLREFDIVKEAGGWHLAVVRKFKTRPRDNKIEIQFISRMDHPSLNRLRIYNDKKQIIFEDSVSKYLQELLSWIPLANKGRCSEFHDWLYHKECVAKSHPVFEGLPGRGIMDWDYYGEVIPHYIFDGQDTPDEVIAAAFAVGYCSPGGYASGVLVGSYAFGAGRFILNTLRILENINCHPAADRLLLNIINYAQKDNGELLETLPSDFNAKLTELGYR